MACAVGHGPWMTADPALCSSSSRKQGPEGPGSLAGEGWGTPTKAGVFPCKAGWGGEGPPRAGLHPAWPPRGDCARWACLLTCGMRMTMKTGRETPALWHPTQRRPCPIPDPVTVLLHGKGFQGCAGSRCQSADLKTGLILEPHEGQEGQSRVTGDTHPAAAGRHDGGGAPWKPQRMRHRSSPGPLGEPALQPQTQGL